MRRCMFGLLMSGVVCTGAALAADRMVLCEEFTATWCGPCVPAGTALVAVEDAHPDYFILLQIHNSDSYAVEPYSTSRMNFYGIGAFPTCWFDGAIPQVGAWADVNQNVAMYTASVNTRLAVPTSVVIDQWATAVDSNTWTVNARYTLEDTAPGPLSMKIRIAQVRDNFPSGAHYGCCLRNISSIQTITLQPGDSFTQVWNADLTTGDANNINRVGFIAFAQETGTGNNVNNPNLTTEMLQANRIMHPFPATPPIVAQPGDANSDGSVDLTDLATLLSHFGITAGGDWDEGDFTGDGRINLDDLSLLLSHFGL